MRENLLYDAVICDLGNVLINFDRQIAVKRIAPFTPKKEEDIYGLFFDSQITELFEKGEITPDEFFYRIKEFLELDMDYDKFLPIWNDIFFEVPLNIKMRNFLRSIKSQYSLVMLSNINKVHFEFLRKRMGIFKDFAELVLSYEVGFRKPPPEIYHEALKRIKVIPSRAFYIDDRKDLIEAASRLGIKGIVFDGEDAFERIVKELSVSCRGSMIG